MWLVYLLAITCHQVLADLTFAESEYADSKSTRILSGWEAQDGQFPHQALLRVIDKSGGVGLCGGSVIGQKWVVTAAHCTAGRKSVIVKAGITDRRAAEYTEETTEWYTHPSYDASQPYVVQKNDISVIKLQRPMSLSKNLKGIRLQSTADAFKNYHNEIVIASGFGRMWTNNDQLPNRLQYVYLRAISNDECKKTYGSGIINDNAICARYYNVTSQSTCNGDSGGPLIHKNSQGEPILIGIASFASGHGCHTGRPAGFIRPGPFHGWLKQVTGIDFNHFTFNSQT